MLQWKRRQQALLRHSRLHLHPLRQRPMRRRSRLLPLLPPVRPAPEKLPSVGQSVQPGDPVVIIEAMKMEIPVVAPEAGTVASIDVAVGDAIEAGAVLATLN